MSAEGRGEGLPEKKPSRKNNGRRRQKNYIYEVSGPTRTIIAGHSPIPELPNPS